MTTDKDSNVPIDSETPKQNASDNQGAIQQPVVKIDSTHVPSELHFLIPLAEKWGIPNRKLREKLLHEASLAEIEALYQVVYLNNDNINIYIRSQLSSGEFKSSEGSIFQALHEIQFSAGSILQEKLPKRWLEIIGWPERFPSLTLDSTKLPTELQVLVPFTNKWVNDEESIRASLIRLASTAELVEFTSVVKQIGVKNIYDSLDKISYDKTLELDRYFIWMLMDLVDVAEAELRKRSG